MAENIFGLLLGYEEASWMVRNAGEICDDFDCAHRYLRDSWSNSDVYLTLSGMKDNEGVVISRNNYGMLNEDWLDVENDKWYVA